MLGHESKKAQKAQKTYSRKRQIAANRCSSPHTLRKGPKGLKQKKKNSGESMFVIPCFKERPIKAYCEGRKIKAN
jgi:hypothetical protein